ARKAIKNFAVNMWRDKKIDSIDVDSEHIPSKDHVPHPCFPKNYTETWSLPNLSDEDTTTLIGTGAGHAQCRFIIEQMLNKTETCPLSPCSFNGVYQPPISVTFSNNEIYIFSYFYDRVSPLGMPSEFSIKELRDLTDDVCAGNINQFEHLPEAMKELRKNPHYCMDLSFIYGLLHIGYEIPLEREVKMAKKIKGIETGWCLGAAISILDQKQWCKP
ncbi:5913_t:CDS:1, partial [Racocetra persica]